MTTNYFRATLFAFFFFSFISVNAQSLEAEVDKVAAEYFKTNEPGGVISIFKNGNEIYKKAFGLANLESTIPMNSDMVFEIGSITKQFTAVAILQLVEQGKLHLNDPIFQYLPDYPVHGKQITIHQLLTHTSGIPNYTNMPQWANVWRNDLSPEETLNLFKNQPLDFKPGSQFNYTNSGYVVLGLLIEKVAGMPYAKYIEQFLFKPAGMSHTQFGSRNAIISNRVQGYQKGETYVNAEYLSFSQPYAAGALMSTASDLQLWNKAIRKGKLISKESLALAITNYKDGMDKNINYGYGWQTNSLYGSPTWEHGGGIFGFVSYVQYFPLEDLNIVVLTNCDSYNPEAISTKVATLLLNKKNIAYPAIYVEPQTTSRYVGDYIFDDFVTRSITLEEGVLYSQIPGGTKIKLIPIAENEFAYQDIIDARIRFDRKEKGYEATLTNRIFTKKGMIKTATEPKRKEITVSPLVLDTYLGSYSIAPNLNFEVLLENNQLYIHFPGQPKVALFATSTHHFFAKLVEATFEFKNNDKEPITVTIRQNGQTIIGTKK